MLKVQLRNNSSQYTNIRTMLLHAYVRAPKVLCEAPALFGSHVFYSKEVKYDGNLRNSSLGLISEDTFINNNARRRTKKPPQAP